MNDSPPYPVVGEVRERFERWVASDAASLPLPGQGRTWERFEALADLAAIDLSLARLAEGHADAVAILDELDAVESGGDGPVIRGVWAAHRPCELVARPTRSGWELHGEKPFCSGAGLVERALVVADARDGVRLLDVGVTDIEIIPGTWPAVGMAASISSRVAWRAVAVDAAQAVGPPGAYTERPGFWWGAVGVAACWWGGARALLDTVRRGVDVDTADGSELADLGAGWARLRGAETMLRDAAGRIDATSDHDAARRTALVTRHVVHDACTVALELAASAGGARPICLEPAQSRRSADLYAYLAQHHRGRDATILGRWVAEER